MKPPLLVLVRWHGDIIAVHGEVPPNLVGPTPLTMCDGVSVEVYDVRAERASLRLTPPIDWRPIAGFVGSAGLHCVVAALALLAFTFPGADIFPIAPELMNQRGAALADPITKIAADESASEQQKEDRAPPAAVDEEAFPEPPPDESAAESVPAEGAAGSDSLSTSPTVCTTPVVAPSRGKKCRRTVIMSPITKRTSCFVDTVAKEGEKGTLTFPCEGDGEATLTFGRKSFKGVAIGGKLDMCTGTEYPFSDGCKWTSAQRVSGSIAGGSLNFTYGEAPKAGQETQSCATACDASGTVHVEGSGWQRL